MEGVELVELGSTENSYDDLAIILDPCSVRKLVDVTRGEYVVLSPREGKYKRESSLEGRMVFLDMAFVL
jgi:hypothetical protein